MLKELASKIHSKKVTCYLSPGPRYSPENMAVAHRNDVRQAGYVNISFEFGATAGKKAL